MIVAVAKRTQNKKAAKPAPIRKSSWPAFPENEEESGPVRGTDAVQHQKGARGRKSLLFPDLNITATAAKLGITKSHLAKVLSGQNRPSIELAKKLAEVLGKDLEFVAALGDNWNRQQQAPKTKPRTKKK